MTDESIGTCIHGIDLDKWCDECAHEVEENECIHGVTVGEYCKECAHDDESDEKYHAAKDDGLLE